jgi:hypothetical protein
MRIRIHRTVTISYSVRITIAIAVCTLPLLANAARQTGNENPSCPNVVVFSPARYELPDGGEVYTQTSISAEGYTDIMLVNDTWPLDDDPETRISDLATQSSGVLFIHTHGNSGALLGEVYATEDARDDAYDAYINDAGEPWTAAEISKYDYACKGATCYGILINDDGVDNHVQDRNDDDGTVIFVAACTSFGLSDNFGGREYFGYDDQTNATKDSHDSKVLWDYMTGIKDEGDSRPANVAYSSGTPHAASSAYKFMDDSSNKAGELQRRTETRKTTLSPVVVGRRPKEIVCDDCVGWVRFDTKMSDFYAESDIVTISDNATLSNFSWNAAKDELSFKITDTVPDTTYTFTVVANRAVSDEFLNLNGNQNPQTTDGKRPNGDNFVWTVTGDAMACDPVFIQRDRRDLKGLSEARVGS